VLSWIAVQSASLGQSALLSADKAQQETDGWRVSMTSSGLPVTALSELFVRITLWAGSVHGYVRSTWLDGLDPWVSLGPLVTSPAEPAGIGSALPTAAVDVSAARLMHPIRNSKLKVSAGAGWGRRLWNTADAHPEAKR
jgi:hypothetical protein